MAMHRERTRRRKQNRVCELRPEEEEEDGVGDGFDENNGSWLEWPAPSNDATKVVIRKARESKLDI